MFAVGRFPKIKLAARVRETQLSDPDDKIPSVEISQIVKRDPDIQKEGVRNGELMQTSIIEDKIHEIIEMIRSKTKPATEDRVEQRV
jgi:hypothetical protein